MLFQTLRCGKRASDWNTMPMLRWWVGSAVMSRSSSTTFPELGVSSPAIKRSNVVLPHPEGPRKEMNLPAGRSRSTSSTAVIGPKRLETDRSSRPGIVSPLPLLASRSGSPTQETRARGCRPEPGVRRVGARGRTREYRPVPRPRLAHGAVHTGRYACTGVSRGNRGADRRRPHRRRTDQPLSRFVQVSLIQSPFFT